jgi:FemAB-related protein (PEP-CTERM system-associated)
MASNQQMFRTVLSAESPGTRALEIPKREGEPDSVLVRPFCDEIAGEWDRFVCEQPQGTFFHSVGWKRVLEKTFGYRSQYFCAERNGKITGVAPLFSIKNWIVGRCLHSVPLAVYGGICARDRESEQALLQHLKQLAVSEKVDYLELHTRSEELFPDFHRNSLYVTFTGPLSPDPDATLRKLPRDTRYMIRKGQKAGLRAQYGPQQIDTFYGLFVQSMKRHGTPVYPRALFENLLQEFGERVDLMVVYDGAKPISGVLSFRFRETILPYYAGAGPEAPRLAANNFMYWEIMRKAAEQGFTCFDFGRSKKGTGSYAFKTQWNMVEEPLGYQVYLVKRKSAPNFSPLNPKFDLAARIWQKLPASLTTHLGPRVVRWFP